MAGELEFMFILWIGTVILMAVVTILLTIVSLWSPGWTFIKAKMRHRDILAGWRRDRKIDFHMTSDDSMVGLAMSKKYNGQYFVNPDNVYVEKKSGVSIIPVNVECGAATSETQLRCIDALKRMGCKNLEEADNMNAIYGKCSCGYEGFMDPLIRKDEKGEDSLIGLKCPHNMEVRNEITEKAEVKGKEEEAAGAIPEGEGEGVPGEEPAQGGTF